jgi:hypothetical protein
MLSAKQGAESMVVVARLKRAKETLASYPFKVETEEDFQAAPAKPSPISVGCIPRRACSTAM